LGPILASSQYSFRSVPIAFGYSKDGFIDNQAASIAAKSSTRNVLALVAGVLGAGGRGGVVSSLVAQGLPDDAIPVVSAQWPSRDDAFLRVAQGIRRVAEKWHIEKSIAAAKVAGSPPTVTMPPPFAPGGRETTQAINDSGAGVMIDGKYFESDSVIEHDNSRFEVLVAPLSAEEEADLRALRPDQRPARRAVSFAHGNEGFMAQVRLARSQSTAGRRVWTVELERIDNEPAFKPGHERE
jgi:hypothetical protein